MKTRWVKKFSRGLLLVGLIGAGMGLAGCADEYAAYPGYHGGYYASYSAPSPYYGGYGYPYRSYGPYYGGYYGSPYYGYGAPYYGSGAVVISGSHSYVSGNRYVYRDRFGRLHRRTANDRVRRTSRTTRSERQTTTRLPAYQSDDEQRYYTPR